MTYPHPMDDKTGFEATDAEIGLAPVRREGKSRLVYDKKRRTIVRTGREELDGEIVACLEKMVAQNGIAWAYAQIANRAAEEIKALRETVRIAAVAVQELPANTLTDAEIKRVATQRFAMHSL